MCKKKTATTPFLPDSKPADDVNDDLAGNGRKKVSDRVADDAKARELATSLRNLYAATSIAAPFRRLGACSTARLLPPSPPRRRRPRCCCRASLSGVVGMGAHATDA